MFRRFKHRPQPKKRSLAKSTFNSKRNRFVLSVIFGLILVCVIFLATFKFLVVKTIKVDNRTQACVNDQEVLDNLHILGKGMFFLDKQKFINILVSKYPCIESVKVSRAFPQTLILSLSPRRPALLIQALSEPDDFEKATRLLKIWEGTSSGKQVDATAAATLIPTLDLSFENATTSGTFVVDDNGIIFSKDVTVIDLPVITAFIDGIDIGQKIDVRIIKNIKTILERLHELETKVTKIKLIKEMYLILEVALPDQLVKKSIFIFLLDRDNQKELASLQLILQRNRIDLRSIESVDLRFDKPIVTFGKKK